MTQAPMGPRGDFPPIPSRRSQVPPAGMPARAAALHLLQSVLRHGHALDEQVATDRRLAELDPRDRNFARLLVATALRRLGQIDDLAGHCLERPLPPTAGTVQDVLRLGVCQLVFLGTPSHAAVDQMVQLTDAAGHSRLKGLVNAVMRRLSRDGGALAAAQDAPRLNTPDWLWQAWSRAYGEVLCRAIAASHLEEAPVDITVRKDAPVWAELLSATLLPTGTLRRPSGGAISTLAGYDEGAWWVQDAAAALPAKLLGPVAGRTVIDLCAAPGGKTAQLAAAGGRVVAVDRSASRLRRLRENLERLKLSAETVSADAALWRPRAPAPFVLLDAPCSATGTIRRHPDIVRLKTPQDVARMVSLQQRLLASAVDMTAPGGTLVYAVCSLQPEEGPDRIAALMAAGAPVRREPVAPDEVAGLERILTREGDIRTLPCHLPAHGGLDGFYIARLRRR